MSDPQKVGPDRTGLMDRFNEFSGVPAEVVTAPAPVAADVTPEETVVPPVVEKAEAAPVEPAAKEVVADPGVKKDEPKEEPKTVPLEALHEAREKIKTRTLEARQLKEQLSVKDQELNDVKARVATLEDTIRKAQAGEEVPPLQDEASKLLLEENKRLKEAQAKAEQEKAQKAQNEANADMQRMISATDDALTQEGFPGFKQFGKDVFDAFVAKINAGELEEKDVTTEMWAKVYKEEVFPAKKAIFDAKLQQEKLDAKKALKKKANLTVNPGEGPAPKEEDNLDAPQTAQSYLAARKRIF